MWDQQCLPLPVPTCVTSVKVCCRCRAVRTVALDRRRGSKEHPRGSAMPLSGQASRRFSNLSAGRAPLGTAPISLKALSLMSRNVMFIEPRDACVPAASGREILPGLPTQQTPISFPGQALCSTPIALATAAAAQRGLGLVICPSSQ